MDLPAWLQEKEPYMLGIILIAVLILALLGVLPRWTHSRNWGYYPTGGVGLILFVVVMLFLLDRI
jgi:FtsH-binding integral membrane protein